MVGKKEKAHFQKKELKTQNIQQGLVTIYCFKISAYMRVKYKTEGKQFKQNIRVQIERKDVIQFNNLCYEQFYFI